MPGIKLFWKKLWKLFVKKERNEIRENEVNGGRQMENGGRHQNINVTSTPAQHPRNQHNQIIRVYNNFYRESHGGVFVARVLFSFLSVIPASAGESSLCASIQR